jgi:hypothetical protein
MCEAPTHLFGLEEANPNSGLDSPTFHPKTGINTISERHFIFAILTMYKVYEFSNPKRNVTLLFVFRFSK